MIYLLQSAENDSGDGLVVLLFLLAIGFVFYMLPTIIARSRNHKQVVPLAIVNFFFGWTFLGWVACLAWSFQSYRAEVPTTPTS